ncbi:hypothetical protein EFM34_09500 [Leuconostoc suionicum]|uniref:hypothetical protein n=2 Tax=Leuconostoc suionicum TaxID=1511761 RepID=UPI0021AA14EA|nr:hypothetical protein [Leuconostoc suionicum]MCT4383445.1 hypothetical protein [Leuconostoc suionicum]
MKHNIISILIAIISVFIAISLTTTSVITGNHLYAKIGSSLLGVVICFAGVMEIKKDGKVIWLHVAPYLPGLFFILNPWIQYL